MQIHRDIKQRSNEWFRIRHARITASHAADLITEKGAIAKNAKRQGYLAAKLAERFTGRTAQIFATEAMRRGTELEPKARNYYATNHPALEEVGCITAEIGGGVVVCSPDGLLPDRGLEIKCPMPNTLVAQLCAIALKDGPPWEYVAQCQFGMLVSGLKQWDLVLYGNLELPSITIAIKRDDAMCAALTEAVKLFHGDLEAGAAAIRDMGGIETPYIPVNSNDEVALW